MTEKAEEIVLRFCRQEGATRLLGGHFGMRCPTHPSLGATCIVCCLDWTSRPNLAEGNTWEEVYVQLAVSGLLDRARVEHDAYIAELRAEKARQEQRGYRRRYYRR